MNFARQNRAVIALLLYSCVLFSSFACALGHGQNSGLLLSGINQLSCSTSDTSAPGEPALPSLSASYDCPVCSGHALAPTNLNGWTLTLPTGSVTHTSGPAYSPLLTTESWPAASPRAPPTHS